MSLNDTDDAQIQRAVGLLFSNVNLKVPEAMHAAQFSGVQSDNRALHQQVRRLYNKRFTERNATDTSPPMSAGVTKTPESAIASISGTSALVALADLASHHPPFLKQTQKTTSQTQQVRANKKAKSNHYKQAFKHVTTGYAQEKENDDDM